MIVQQLFAVHEDRRTVGKVCAVVMIVGGILIDLAGAARYLSQSRALLQSDHGNLGPGKAILAAPYILLIGSVVGFVCIGLFVLVTILA